MKNAFSLVELSIVLVILGLLTGGILTGQSLIRAAELRAVTTEFQTYQTAIMTFRDKYFALPGDMRNAADFWGAEDSGDGLGADCYDVASSNSDTCNGNGDGIVGNWMATSTVAQFEAFRSWQHLANAGLIEGSYTGVGNTLGTGGDHSVCVAGQNCPPSKLRTAVWLLRSEDAKSGDTNWYDFAGGNVMFFGGPLVSNAANNPHGAVVTPEEAWNLDTKVDDGKPAYGKLRTFKTGGTASWAADTNDCATSATASSAEYDLLDSSKKCALVFILR